MSDDRLQQVEKLYHDALALPANQREAFVKAACGADAGLAGEVESLLSQYQSKDSLFDQPLWSSMSSSGESAIASKLLVGSQLGPYQIAGLLGAGGMGRVFRAHDSRLQRSVAVKVLLPEQDLRRFEREARALAALSHRNVVPIFDIGHEGGLDYLVEELVEGESLRDTLRSGPLSIARFRHLAVQIAEGLDAAHRAGIIHCDLKPENIMVTPEDCARILDFGLATGRRTGSDAANTSLSQPGAVTGTPAYMSPEQAEGKSLDARSDIFSFGLVLYEMLSGRRAFTGDSAASIMTAIVHEEPKPLDTTLALESILARCLRKSPADRFQSVTQVRDGLLAATSEVSWPGAADSGVQATLQAQSSSAIRTPSIAVLPFVNLSGDKENEYFSDGLAEEMLNFLSQIPGLKVTARTSAFAFKGKAEDIRKIADALGVTTILEGSVRRSGSRIRVTAQLINPEDGCHLWSERYDRELADVFAMQDEIARAIVSALRVKFSGAPAPFEQYRPNLAAYEALLKARHYQRTAVTELRRRAKECYEQAIELDPKFALAHCEYGIYFLSLTAAGGMPAEQSLPIVRSLAEKALALDPFLSEGEAMLGIVAAFMEDDWTEAARRFRQAMSRDPVPVNVRFQYALGYLLRVGRPVEALQQIDLGLQEDPLNPLLRINRAGFLAAAGRDEEAAEGYREALEVNPNIAGALGPLAAYHTWRGEIDQALVLCEKAYGLAPLLPHVIGLFAGLLKRTGSTRRADELLGKLQPTDAFGAPRGLAVYHWVLREFDAEADWLEKAIDQRDNYASLFLRGWYGRELCSTPRWAGLMRRLKLPESDFGPPVRTPESPLR
jgi:eukaryotic-like serine/threonine-protein kinase